MRTQQHRVRKLTHTRENIVTHLAFLHQAQVGAAVGCFLDSSDLNNAGASYFIEGQYVCSDEAEYNNQFNNCSWRQVNFNSLSNPSAVNSTQVAEPAIFAWKEQDSEVDLQTVQVPNDGQLHIGARAYDNGDGSWDYEYAIHNMNSDRCVGSVAIGVGSAATNVGFHSVPYHSGEVIDSSVWSMQQNGGSLSWATSTYDQNQWANAIRWGSVYNFRFTSTSPPVKGTVVLGLFKPGSGADTIEVQCIAPKGTPVDPCTLPLGPCPADVDGDYVVAVGDLLEVIGSWGECGDGTYRPVADVDGSCCVEVGDVLAVISAWGADCATAGACCLPAGGCSEGSSDDCNSMGGTYLGDESTCAQSNCPETGACCFSDGGCDDLMITNCINKGGGFQGEGSACETEKCPVAGSGDECNNAMIASVGANAFETNTATPSGNEPDSSQCSGTYLDWANSQDIWFSFVPSQSGSTLFTTCDSSSYDTSMVLYQGECDNQIACNGDSNNGSGCQAYHSAIEHNVSAGENLLHSNWRMERRYR